MPGAVYQVVIAGTLAKQSVANVLNFDLSAGDGDPVAQAQALIAALGGDFMSAYVDCLPVSYVATSMKCKRVSLPGGPTTVEIYGSTDWVGTRTGEVSTTSAGPVVLSQGQRGSRYVTAKIFMPGVSETDIGANVFTGALLAKLDIFINVIKNDVILDGDLGIANYIIYHRATRSPAEASNWKVSLKPGTQRRRLVPIA